MQEFSLIQRYCQAVGVSHPETLIGVGDDAAVIQVPADNSLVVSVDSMVEGVHFFADTKPELIAQKLAAVNLSDMAAMGAVPKWATLAMTLPDTDTAWLDTFFHGLYTSFNNYGVQLVGGDTTQGALCLSMQIMGLSEKDKALTRSGAQAGDDIYVSGVVGDAALALAAVKDGATLNEADLIHCQQALDTPVPQLELGQKLVSVASAAIDISDGLVADLGHIAQASGVSLQIDIDSIPLSDTYRRYLDAGGTIDLALSGGDDYQLAFCAPAAHQSQIKQIGIETGVPLTRIGSVTEKQASGVCLKQQDGDYQLKQNAGYQHFDL